MDTMRINDISTGKNVNVTIISSEEIADGTLHVVRYNAKTSAEVDCTFAVIEYADNIVCQNDWQSRPATADEIADTNWVDCTPVYDEDDSSYDIYIGTNNEEPTAHGAEYVFDGFNPADAITRFVSSEDAMRELRMHYDNVTELSAFDDEMSASIFPLEDGSYELHIYVDETDTAITIPPTEFMSITDAADELDISRQRVHVLLKDGTLSGRMVGNAWIVCRESVENRMQHQK